MYAHSSSSPFLSVYPLQPTFGAIPLTLYIQPLLELTSFFIYIIYGFNVCGVILRDSLIGEMNPLTFKDAFCYFKRRVTAFQNHLLFNKDHA